MGKKTRFYQLGPYFFVLNGVKTPDDTNVWRGLVRWATKAIFGHYPNKGLKHVKLRLLDGKSTALCASSCKIHNTYMNKTYNYKYIYIYTYWLGFRNGSLQSVSGLPSGHRATKQRSGCRRWYRGLLQVYHCYPASRRLWKTHTSHLYPFSSGKCV